jgi:hypothetical protein
MSLVGKRKYTRELILQFEFKLRTLRTRLLTPLSSSHFP